MTVSNAGLTAKFYGNGTLGPFSFNFRFLVNSDIAVTKTLYNNVFIPLAEGTDYTLTGAGGYVGGAIMLNSPLVSGETLSVERMVPITQPIDLRNQGSFFPEIVETGFDRLTMIMQQLNNRIGIVQVTASGSSVASIHLEADASTGDVIIDILGLTDVIISKYDNTKNTVTIIDSSGKSICRGGLDPLYIQDETIHLVLFGGNWKKVS